jgi:hypothetical protein
MRNNKNDTILNLCISIFYSSREWHKIALEAIYPFLWETSNIISYMVLMNSDRGDNIRLILEVEEKNAWNVANLVNTHFQDYLTRSPSKPGSSFLDTPNKLFKNFENNTIHYGIYEFYEIKGFTNHQNEYHVALSDLLKEIFLEEKNEVVENTFVLLLRMLLIFFNLITYNNKTIIQVLEEILEENQQNNSEVVLEENCRKSSVIYNENRSELIEFSSEYTALESEDYEYEWEKKWHHLIKMYYEKFKASYTDYQFFDSFFFPVCQMLDIKHSNVALTVLLRSVKKN